MSFPDQLGVGELAEMRADRFQVDVLVTMAAGFLKMIAASGSPAPRSRQWITSPGQRKASFHSMLKLRLKKSCMSTAVSCPERDLHLKHYQDAMRAYLSSVVGLEADLSPNRFEVAYKRAEEARTLFEHTRQQLKAHVAAHGCQNEESSKELTT
jgi:hypothetical protein